MAGKARGNKGKEKYTELHGLLGNAQDYHVYHMKKTDYLASYMLGFLGGAFVVYVFFRALAVALLGGAVCTVLVPPHYNTYRKNARLKRLREQYKDLLESLTASYSAGRNTQGAFEDAWKDMVSVYGEDADISRELQIICYGMKNNINIEQLLLDFADRSDLDDVMSFANVFEACSRQGSDMKRIVSQTRDIINDKIEIEMEIETMLAGNKNELNIMMVMPLVVVLSLSTMGAGTIVANTAVNVLVKLVCLGIFGGAYLIGRKTVDIRI